MFNGNTEELASRILQEYAKEVGSICFPIDEKVLVRIVARRKNIDIELKEKEEVIRGRGEGALIPRKGGFILCYGKRVTSEGGVDLCNQYATKRFTICHELAHVLFYDCSGALPKCREEPREDQCDAIARKVLLPQTVLANEFAKNYDFGKPLIPFLRELSNKTSVALYPIVKRLVEDLSLIKNTMITFWKYQGGNQESDVDIKDFRRDSKTSPELRRYISGYWRHLIATRVWEDMVREAALEGTRPQIRPLRIKTRTRDMLLSVECEPLSRSSPRRFLPSTRNHRPVNDVLSVEKFNLKL